MISGIFAVVFSFFIFTSVALAEEINIENVVNLANQSRLDSGLNELFINPTLNRVASKKAHNMIKYHYFSHTSPAGIDPWYWFKDEGYDYKYAGENLAINYKTAADQQAAWMTSPTHRKNIMNPNYEEIGVATASGYINNKPANITVQVFGTPQVHNTTTAYNNSVLLQESPVIPYVLGKQINYPIQTQYLNQSTTPSTENRKANISINNKIFEVIKNQSHNILWVIILILCIVIIRDIVLKSINPPIVRHHSITNLILLIMLWSMFIGM